MKPIPAFENARLLVVGDVMLDRYWHGDTSRISPEAPVPVVRVDANEERAGGAGNVALNIAALGAKAAVVGLTGNDEAANVLNSTLRAANVQCHFYKVEGLPTITKLRIISRHQQLIRLDFETGFPESAASSLVEEFKNHLDECDVVILSDYNKGALRKSRELIAIAKEQGKKVIIDPKGYDFSRYHGATLLTPNMGEFEMIVGHCANDEEIESRGMQLIETHDLEALLITRSEKGMTLLQKGEPAVHIPTRARDVYDVTGAGDTVVSVLASSLAAGETLYDATVLANIAAGVVVGKLGTASVTVPELRRALHAQKDMARGIVDEESLVALVQEAKAHGEKVIMTNGCFDILHAGHVTYLEESAQLGDRLIVAVNDDASVKRLKGEERPVNTQAKRMRVLAALDCVDWVVGFDEDTPTRLICNISPDVLVKGGDNDPDNIPGGECVRKAGGEVRVMSYVENTSTTGIIGSIRKSEKKNDA